MGRQKMIELQNLLKNRPKEQHCSDFGVASAEGGSEQGNMWHGHNEDWSAEVGELYYYLKLSPSPGSSREFEPCAGLAYPGSLIGWAPTWNAHGVITTVNTLVPDRIETSGVSTSFIQRDAICGIGNGRTLKDVAEKLADKRWADGASINVVDTANAALANVETYLNSHDTLMVLPPVSNYSHFNLYKRLSVAEQSSASSEFRQWVADALPAPHGYEAIGRQLSYFPFLRDSTIATLLVDGSTGRWVTHLTC